MECFHVIRRSPDKGHTASEPTGGIIYSDGSVLHVLPLTLHTTCPVNMKRFPFDSHICSQKMGFWTYSTKQAYFEHRDSSEIKIESHLSQWNINIKDSYLEIKNRSYKQYVDLDYSEFLIHVAFSRKYAMYVCVLVIPAILLSALTPILFVLPIDGYDKAALGEFTFQHIEP